MKIDIYVQPGAKKSSFAGEHGGRLKVKISAPPVDGAANEAVCRFFAEYAGVAKSDVKIISGSSSRIKLINIEGNEKSIEKINKLLLDLGIKKL